MAVDATELGALPIFATLTPLELERLAAGADRVEIDEPGVELTREGDFGHSAFVVLSGSARVDVGGADVRELTTGDLFGEVGRARLGPPHRHRRLVDADGAGEHASSSDLWEIEETNQAFAADAAPTLARTPRAAGAHVSHRRSAAGGGRR